MRSRPAPKRDAIMQIRMAKVALGASLEEAVAETAGWYRTKSVEELRTIRAELHERVRAAKEGRTS